jgi:hypothetical protein
MALGAALNKEDRMADCVVTVPKTFWFNGKEGLAAWVDEGDLPGEPWSGNDSHFYLGGSVPNVKPGDRVYVVCEGKLRGYAPLVRVERDGNRFALVRRGGAVAVTIDEPVRGFQGVRYRWWNYEAERPFPDWQTP